MPLVPLPWVLGILGGMLFVSYLFVGWTFRTYRWLAFGPFVGAAIPFVLIFGLWFCGIL